MFNPFYRFYKILFGVFFILLIVVACRSNQSDIPNVINTAIVPRTNDFNNQITNSSITKMPSETPALSQTNLSLSLKATPSTTVQPATPKPSLSPADQATQDYKNALRATSYARVATEMAFLPGCYSPIEHNYSPDNKWVAIICVNPVTYIYHVGDNSKAWAVKYNELIGQEDEKDNQFFTIWPWHWSPDGRYLYLSVHPQGDGGCPLYLDATYLVRLDLQTGKTSFTLKSDGAKFYSISFSPDDSDLAYLRTWIKHPILNIENLITGSEQHIPLGEQYNEAGSVIWSPDKSRVIVSARTLTDCQNMKFYIISVDLSDQNLELLWEGTNPGYIPVDWTDENHILLRDYFSYDQAIFDLDTLAITPIPTPTATP